MADPPLPTDRFFARIRSLDMECPRCGTVYICTEYRGPYSRKTGIFCCRHCQFRVALGVLAYRITTSPVARAPTDWIPTPAQAMALRQAFAGGHLVGDGDPTQRRGWSDPHNVVLEASCRCEVHARGLIVNPTCPVHAIATRAEPPLVGPDKK